MAGLGPCRRALALARGVAKRIARCRAHLALAAALAGCAGEASPPPPAGDGADAAPTAPAGRPAVILFIGDGMGARHIEAARRVGGELAMTRLPHRGQVVTASLSGTTDSAAAATALASGVATTNGAVGVDQDGVAVETLVERAKARGLATGVVTTATLSHATPAGFSAHQDSRADEIDIARDQALRVQPDVLLGGGARFYRDLVEPMREAGYQLVEDADALAAAGDGRLLGLFADGHLAYTADRAADTREPTLAEMALRAAEILDQDPDGFFLMVEGARIDMASHLGDLPRAIGETRAFDEAIAAVAAWADGRDDVTLLVTADHECGGLSLGDGDQHSWKWGRHTSAPVDLFAGGPGAELVAGRTFRHPEVHALLRSLVDGEPPATGGPPLPALPDGWTGDLRHLAAEQRVASGFDPAYNRLDAFRLDADPHALSIGIDGLFEWDGNAVVVLIDVDLGAGTGLAALPGAIADRRGRIDAILSSLAVDASAIAGFGADLAVTVWGGSEPPLEERWGDAGVRGLRPPYGRPDDLGWLGAAVAFAEGARAGAGGGAAEPGRGLELRVPWATLYPDGLPAGARLGLVALLVNDDGTYLSNQVLPPLAPGSQNPGTDTLALPGVVEWVVDADGDRVVDGDAAPRVRIE
ncbi:MAG TPA: alkaline phosphatase [Kofleriaceae bacterium]|nr:alkaline phosphatase [Kofleriaceae bacterium]